jgi:riboflavin kinase / FMN adenylyltransferase
MVVTHGFLPAAVGAGRGWAVTIGNFDGVHRGHRALLDHVNARARELDIGSCVLTFEPHPREYFAKSVAEGAPPRVTRLRDKLELLAAAGVGRVHVAPFGARLASLSAGEFIEAVLVRGLQTRALVVGRDFRFGKGRAGDLASLRAAGLDVQAIPDVVDGERISSSSVRAALQAGDLERAQTLLGHPYFISGRVVRGARLGRELGFPTANIPLRRPPPLSGIFVVQVDGLGDAVASVGLRPTVNPVPSPLLEVHLLDFSGDLYGRRLRVRFLRKLRDEEKYDGLEALKAAISSDVRRARDYFGTHG